MREHKYRAWHTEQQKMYSPEEMGADQITLMPDGRGFVNVSGTSTRLSQFYPHMIPLEYTGLKDKNGVEIYEGDILKWLGRIHKVESTFGGWNPFIDDMQTDGSWHYEVIGNIYSNPELPSE